MTLAYLMNSYPMTSTTFIRTEIAAHEKAGHDVLRFAIRPYDVALVDPQDIAEAGKVTYILKQGPWRIGGALLAETLTNPLGILREPRIAFSPGQECQ